MMRRDLVGDAGIASLALGADDALGERGRGWEVGAGDFLGGESAHFAERECHLCIERYRRMTARKDEPQPVVFHVRCVELDVTARHRIVSADELVGGGVETCAAPQFVDRLEPTG